MTMATVLNIQVADDLKEALASRASESGYPSVEAYVEELVRAEVRRVEYGAPGRLQPGSRQELEAMIREGVDSPVREMSPADWQEMRRRLVEGRGKQKAG